MQRKVTLTDAMTNITELLESDRSIYPSDSFVKIWNRVLEVQRLSGMVESKDLKLQTIPGLVEEASRLREELLQQKEDEDRSETENKSMLALSTKRFQLKQRLVPLWVPYRR